MVESLPTKVLKMPFMRIGTVRPPTFLSNNRKLVLRQHPPQIVTLSRGHAFARKPASLFWEESKEGTVRWIVGIDQLQERAAYLLSGYDVHMSRRGERFRLWCPTSAADRRAAMKLLEVEHPRRASPTGMLLCLRSLDEFESGNASLVGAALIGEIFHTNLVERDAFAPPILGHDWLARVRNGSLGRDDVVHGLHLTCGKRFAIRKDRVGQKLGDLLALHTGIAAATHRWPPADFIEICRYMPERDFFTVCYHKRRDFLTRSGYVPVPSWRWSNHQETANGRSSIAASSRPILGYYYKAIRGHRERDDILRQALERGR
jgi:hypothetical protein